MTMQASQMMNLLKAHESVGLPRNEQGCAVMKEAFRLTDDLSMHGPKLQPILEALSPIAFFGGQLGRLQSSDRNRRTDVGSFGRMSEQGTLARVEAGGPVFGGRKASEHRPSAPTKGDMEMSEQNFGERLQQLDEKFGLLAKLMAQCVQDEPVETKATSFSYGTVETSGGLMTIVPSD